jgi:hypothetical protein
LARAIEHHSRLLDSACEGKQQEALAQIYAPGLPMFQFSQQFTWIFAKPPDLEN